MKKQLVLMTFAAMFSITAVNAQGGGGMRQTPEEATKATIEKMAPLNLDAETKAKSDAIIAEYFNTRQKAMEEMRAGGSFDREAWGVKRKELADARDAKLKAIFTEAQMKQWIEVIEPSTRPQRQGGGGGGGN
jgi:periplasmic protein CpxP/Spy